MQQISGNQLARKLNFVPYFYTTINLPSLDFLESMTSDYNIKKDINISILRSYEPFISGIGSFCTYKQCVEYILENLLNYSSRIKKMISDLTNCKNSFFCFPSMKKIYEYEIEKFQKVLAIIETYITDFYNNINLKNEDIDLLDEKSFLSCHLDIEEKITFFIKDNFDIFKNFYFVKRNGNSVYISIAYLIGFSCFDKKIIFYAITGKNKKTKYEGTFDSNGNLIVQDFLIGKYCITQDYDEAKKYADNLIEKIHSEIKIVKYLS